MIFDMPLCFLSLLKHNHFLKWSPCLIYTFCYTWIWLMTQSVYTQTHTTHTQSVIIIIMIGSNLYLPKQGSNIIKDHGLPFQPLSEWLLHYWNFSVTRNFEWLWCTLNGGGRKKGLASSIITPRSRRSIFNPSHFSWFTMWLPHGRQEVIFWKNK